MTYRFTNKGEKSAPQIVYEWLEKNPIGFEFCVEDIDAEVNKSNASASCSFFEEKGVIETIGRKKLIRKGKSGKVAQYNTRVYRFVEHYEGRFNSRHSYKSKRTRTFLKKRGPLKIFQFPIIGEQKPEQPLPEQKQATLQLTHQNMIDFMIGAIAYFEGVIKENERLRKLLDEKV